MSDKKKPDQGHCGSNGEDDGNRCRLLDRYSLEEIRLSLEWLILIASTTGFLAFQLITNAIFEEEYERDVAWIAKQSRSMSSIDEADDYMEDDDFEFEDIEDEEELQNQVEEAEGDRAEDEMPMEEGAAAATRLVDLGTCTLESEEAIECECEDADEEAAKEKEEDETEEPKGESKKNLDSAKGSLP
ncbi:tumor rejection antigen P815A [Phodopus roborovskii]|uniref:tumor rejection antigen P815A n=1 Tax=Phodopus roborovskii TaxID=109678 RepID=UPI0021E3EC30|nr:tumor rejection antigen P815A [Phodopus roborovskii]